MINLLFVCSKNQWRSPTAEGLFKNHPAYQAHSAGTSDKARIRVNQKMIDRADMIFVMERKHRDILRQQFELTGKSIILLNIPDEYQFNDPELIEMLQQSLAGHLEL